jgi:methionyl-tRNA synthetase
MLIETLKAMPNRIAEKHIDREGLAEMMELARQGQVLWQKLSWKLIKTDLERVGTILNIALQIAANISLSSRAIYSFQVPKN